MPATSLLDGLSLFSRCSALIGLSYWIPVASFALPDAFGHMWGHAILMLAAGVVVPLGLSAITLQIGPLRPLWLWTAAVVLQPLAAISLTWSLLQSQSLIATAASLPWLLFVALIAVSGLARLARVGVWPPGEIGISGGLVLLVVGGGWAVFDRYGFQPLGFEPVIVILTAIHFHYAGFALPVLAGLASRLRPTRLTRWTEWSVVIAVPGVAVGTTLTQLGWDPVFETIAALWMAFAGLCAAAVYARLAFRPGSCVAERVCWTVLACGLTFGMGLATLYGLRPYHQLEWLDIPWMRAWHGTANLAACLTGLIGWNLAQRQT